MYQVKYGKGSIESIFEFEIMVGGIDEEIKWSSEKLHLECLEISHEEGRFIIELCTDEHLFVKFFTEIGSYNILEPIK